MPEDVGSSVTQHCRRAKQEWVPLPAYTGRYQTLYESVPAMYFVVDTHGRVLSVNQYGAEQLGYRVYELRGQSVFNVFREQDRAVIRAQINACFERPGHLQMIDLSRDKDRVVVKVADNGIGFNSSKVEANGADDGFGLLSIRERLRLIGGQLRVNSAQRRGTQVMVTAPLGSQANA